MRRQWWFAVLMLAGGVTSSTPSAPTQAAGRPAEGSGQSIAGALIESLRSGSR